MELAGFASDILIFMQQRKLFWIFAGLGAFILGMQFGLDTFFNLNRVLIIIFSMGLSIVSSFLAWVLQQAIMILAGIWAIS